MGFLTNWITDWLKEVLVNGIIGNLSGLFDNANNQIGDIAANVGTSPADFHPGVFALIRNLSETVVLPIAGLILTFIATHELISLIIDKNNMHEIDTWIFFKWVFKTMIAVVILSNTFTTVMAVFDVAQSVVNSAAGIISGSTAVDPGMMVELEARLLAMDIGPLIGIFMQSFLIQAIALALDIIIFIIIYGRMIELFLLTSLAPIPFSTLSNQQFGSMGQNYFKSLCAIGFQGFLIMVCVAIYAVLIQSMATSGDPLRVIWQFVAMMVLLAFTLFKTGSIAKGIFGTS